MSSKDPIISALQNARRVIGRWRKVCAGFEARHGASRETWPGAASAHFLDLRENYAREALDALAGLVDAAETAVPAHAYGGADITGDQLSSILRIMGLEPGQPWAPSTVEDVMRVVTEARYHPIEWLQAVQVFDISEEVGAWCLVGLEVDQRAPLRLTSGPLRLEDLRAEGVDAAQAARYILECVKGVVDQMTSNLRRHAFATQLRHQLSDADPRALAPAGR